MYQEDNFLPGFFIGLAVTLLAVLFITLINNNFDPVVTHPNPEYGLSHGYQGEVICPVGDDYSYYKDLGDDRILLEVSDETLFASRVEMLAAGCVFTEYQ